MIFGLFKKKPKIEKVKCTACRREILIATAESCGGLCMPCFMQANDGLRPDELKKRRNNKPRITSNFVRKIADTLLLDSADRFKYELELIHKKPKEYEKQGLDEKYGFGILEWQDAEEFAPEAFFERFATEHDYSLEIDWSGENDDWELFEWIQSRLKNLQETPWDKSTQESFDKSIDFDKLQRGEYILKKFQHFANQLAKQDLVLAFLNTGADCYFPFIVNHEAYRSLPKKNSKADDYFIHDASKL